MLRFRPPAIAFACCLAAACSAIVEPDPSRLGAPVDVDAAVTADAGAGGGCAPGLLRCGGACVNPATDTASCGGCGRVCGPGESCISGVCTCPPGTSCAPVLGNPDSCGASGQVCADSQVCGGDRCVCRPGLTDVGGRCVDLRSDPSSCGSPGNRCPGDAPVCSGGVCRRGCPDALSECDGACVDTRRDPRHCGGCFDGCDRDQVCVDGNCRDYRAAGSCSACGGDEPTCCSYAGGTICVEGSSC